MKKELKVLLLTLFFITPSLAQEYAVIANKKIKNLSTSQVKAIFLKKIRVIDGSSLVPLNLKARDPLREAFEKELLHMSFNRLKKYWTKKHYLGVRPPITLKSQESIKTFVKKVDGAISYVEATQIDDDVNVLYRWED